jgi:hypothetical protein
VSLSSDINDFFNKYGELFDMETINYTRNVVQRVISYPNLNKFFIENQITAQMLLNELTPISQFKFTRYGDVKLDVDELQSIFNIILFSNDLEQLMIDEHASFNSIGEMGELYYITDEFGSDFLNERFKTKIVPYEEFDFTVLDYDDEDDDEDDDGTDDPNLGGFGLN